MAESKNLPAPRAAAFWPGCAGGRAGRKIKPVPGNFRPGMAPGKTHRFIFNNGTHARAAALAGTEKQQIMTGMFGSKGTAFQRRPGMFSCPHKATATFRVWGAYGGACLPIPAPGGTADSAAGPPESRGLVREAGDLDLVGGYLRNQKWRGFFRQALQVYSAFSAVEAAGGLAARNSSTWRCASAITSWKPAPFSSSTIWGTMTSGSAVPVSSSLL